MEVEMNKSIKNKQDLERKVVDSFLSCTNDFNEYKYNRKGEDNNGVDVYIKKESSELKVQLVALESYYKDEIGKLIKTNSHQAINSGLENLKNTEVEEINLQNGKIFNLNTNVINGLESKLHVSIIETLKKKINKAPAGNSILIIHLGFTNYVDLILSWTTIYEEILIIQKNEIEYSNQYNNGIFLLVKNQINDNIKSYKIKFENKENNL
jgi:hypothetical protein